MELGEEACMYVRRVLANRGAAVDVSPTRETWCWTGYALQLPHHLQWPGPCPDALLEEV